MAGWRTVRVFISSTFRDMHAERDHLVKVVFPRLRERLEPYRMHFVDVDLRWGVTREQADNDMALDLCLQQIDECRPFFVGILGQRYGWVPEEVPEEAISTYGWIQHQTGKSITELEILYGVLHKPEMRSRALFFFRDPSFIEDVPPTKRSDVQVADTKSAAKLTALKDAICQAGLPVPPEECYPCRYAGLRLNLRLAKLALDEADCAALEQAAAHGLVAPDAYAGLSDDLRAKVEQLGVVYLDGLEPFGQMAYERLWQAIRAEYDLPDEPPMQPGGPLALEADFHERFVEAHVRVYVGREGLGNELAAYAEGDETHPCLLTGPSGSGKSAALAKFVRTCAAAHEGDEDVLLVPHFVGASAASTSLRQMLGRLCQELQRRFAFEATVEREGQPAETRPVEVPQDTNALITTFRDFLARVPAGTRVVLVIDGLNQLDEIGNAHAMYWLPRELLPHVKVVVSCIADPGREERVIEAFDRRPCRRVQVQPLTDGERLEIVSRVPSLSAKALDAKQRALLLANSATKNPLFLLVALEELRGFGSFEQLNDRIGEFPKTGDTLSAIFAQALERLAVDFDAGVVRQTLELLACARRGLADRELLELIEGVGTSIDASTSDLFPVLRQLRAYLQRRGELNDFFHRHLYQAARKAYLSAAGDRSDVHGRLAEYFDGQDYWMESLAAQRARAKRLPPTPRPANIRKVDELPWQRLQVAILSGQDDPHSPHWDAVADLLTDCQFLEAKAEADPTGQHAAAEGGAGEASGAGP